MSAERRDRLSEGWVGLPPPEPVPLGRVFANRMRHWRDRRNLSQQGLSDRLEELGVALDRAAITRIEFMAVGKKGQRKVSLEEAFAIAAALNISPARLLVPPDPQGFTEGSVVSPPMVAITPTTPVLGSHLLAWVRGQVPLPTTRRVKHEDDYSVEFSDVAPGGEEEFFAAEADPVERRYPGMRHMDELVRQYRLSAERRDHDAMKRQLRFLAQELQRQQEALDLLASDSLPRTDGEADRTESGD